MIKTPISLINDWSGGQDTKTPIISMALNKSPNMRNFHCAGVKERLMKRGGFAKINTGAVESDNLDVYYPPGYQVADYALRDTAARTALSQGFKCNTSSTVIKIRLWLKKVGTPAGTDTITAAIHANSSGVPNATAITNGTATAVDISDTATLVTTAYVWVTFTFATNPTLVAGTQYHLVLTGAFDIDGTNYIYWGMDNYDVIYQDGSISVNDGTTWVANSTHNACFEIYITGGAKGNDGSALFDFSSKSMYLGVFGTSIYKMDKNSSGTPDGTFDPINITGTTGWDTYTKLMLHMDGTDASTTFTDEIGKTVTPVGNVQIDTAQKKFGTASGLFDGTGDYLSLADSDDWKVGTGDFTVDFWIRYNDKTGNQQYFAYITSSPFNLRLSLELGGTTISVYTNGTNRLTPTWSPSDGTQYHIALVRYSGTITLYIDGVALSSVADTQDISTGDAFYIGYRGDPADQRYFNGWIDEFRFSKGIARWTADFTPPTAAYSNTQSSSTLTSSRYWTFGDWQSGTSLINTDIGLYKYTGSGDAAVVSGAPLGKFFTIWRNYCFIFGIRGNANQGRYSDLSDYTTWTATNTLNFNTNDGDVVTGVRILKGKMFVFKRYSVHRVSYLGSNPTFQVDPILGVGTPSHYSIKEVDMGGDIGSVLIFLTTDKKLAIFDGYNIQVISDVITEETNDLFASADDQPLSFADINLSYADLFHAVVKHDTYEYILYCVLGSDTVINYAFVLDYRTGGIYPYDGQIFASSLYGLSTSKAKILYTAGYAGYMFQMESGNSDNDSAINAYWVSGKIKPSLASLMNKMLQIGLHLKEITSASTINLALQYRLDWNVSWTTAENHNFDHNDELAFGKTSLSDIGTIDNMFQIKLKDNSTNPAPTIYGIDLYGVPLGLGSGDRATA
uniref:Putative baseplate wedge initiator n=1 Tax=viral metagenome TaxID=1070528 RepID=A0A6M3KFW8_9ZZZZ